MDQQQGTRPASSQARYAAVVAAILAAANSSQPPAGDRSREGGEGR